MKGEAEEGKPGGTNWGQKGIRRWATAGERPDWNRRVQGNGPKRRAQHNGQVRRRASGRGRDRDQRVQVSDQESVAADHHVLVS
ncbi:hypothetical protein RHGRI_015513 [Rhododendron griersonianum]|uniref:Uncharacterized protein n=1 Tax=Rhododendron griersonianum TaxID=479676 RepID=A0AAV6KDK2_9ERIC|nr:hypothetical protein RHGRI_015513 [Rhododendron griersonianum]